jgi:hypothetical protein
MAVIGKELQKGRPDFVNAAHFGPIAKPSGISPQKGHLFPRTAFRQGGWQCPESVQRIRGLPQQR